MNSATFYPREGEQRKRSRMGNVIMWIRMDVQLPLAHRWFDRWWCKRGRDPVEYPNCHSDWFSIRASLEVDNVVKEWYLTKNYACKRTLSGCYEFHRALQSSIPADSNGAWHFGTVRRKIQHAVLCVVIRLAINFKARLKLAFNWWFNISNWGCS